MKLVPRMTVDRWDTFRLALILCGAAPFLFFLHTVWGHAALLAYLLTALFFGLALIPAYPPLGTSWFWKAVVPIIFMHSAITFVLVWLNLGIPEINKWPRAIYGFASIILVIEWRVSLRIIDALEPHQKQQSAS